MLMKSLEKIADEKTSCSMILSSQRQLSAWKPNLFMQMNFVDSAHMSCSRERIHDKLWSFKHLNCETRLSLLVWTG
jgi:hypothetical protein